MFCTSDGAGDVTQPDALVLGEVRRNGLVNGGVVLVEPAALGRGESVNVDRIEIDRRAGEILEVHELAELVLHALPAEQLALDADAVGILNV